MEERKDKEQEAEAQSLVLMLRQYQAQVEVASQELAIIRQAITEHEKAIETLKQLKKMEEGAELIVPLGAGTSIYVTLSNTEKIIVGLGGGVSAEKDPDASLEYLTEKRRELENSQREITGTLQKIEQEAQKLQMRLQEIAATGET